VLVNQRLKGCEVLVMAGQAIMGPSKQVLDVVRSHGLYHFFEPLPVLGDLRGLGDAEGLADVVLLGRVL